MLKGFKHSEKTKNRISKNNARYWLGKKLSKEHRIKLSESHSGEKHRMYGEHHSKESKKRLSETRKRLFREGKLIYNKPMLGKHHSEETKQKIREKKKLNPTRYWSGKKRSKETNDKISEALKGEKSSSWLGGISFEPYGLEFTKRLREIIRKRDNYECQECHIKQSDLNKKLAIHHIDYNKKNNNPNNLISLCTSCHQQTNFKREDWTNYFQEKSKGLNTSFS